MTEDQSTLLSEQTRKIPLAEIDRGEVRMVLANLMARGDTTILEKTIISLEQTRAEIGEESNAQVSGPDINELRSTLSLEEFAHAMELLGQVENTFEKSTIDAKKTALEAVDRELATYRLALELAPIVEENLARRFPNVIGVDPKYKPGEIDSLDLLMQNLSPLNTTSESKKENVFGKYGPNGLRYLYRPGFAFVRDGLYGALVGTAIAGPLEAAVLGVATGTAGAIDATIARTNPRFQGLIQRVVSYTKDLAQEAPSFFESTDANKAITVIKRAATWHRNRKYTKRTEASAIKSGTTRAYALLDVGFDPFRKQLLGGGFQKY